MPRIVLAVVIALALVVSLPLCGRVAAQEQRQSDEREPNNERRLADVVGAMSIHGSMSAQGDVDWFVLRGQEGTNPTFTILHAPGNDFDFEVFSEKDPVGRALGVSAGDSISCAVPGRCYIRVWSARGAGAYVIRIAEREPNDQRRLSDPVSDMLISGHMSSERDVDWFVLLGQEGTNPAFTILHGRNNDFDFEVYSGNAGVGRAIGTDSGDNIRCRVPGTCYVRVWSSTGTGPYVIRIDTGSEREPNDERRLADPVSTMLIRGSISAPGDVDWFVLRGQEGTNPSFTIVHDSDDDFDFEVYSGDTRMGRALGTRSGDSISCRVPGRCYVRVWGHAGAGPYMIRVNRGGVAPVRPVPPGVVVRPTAQRQERLALLIANADYPGDRNDLLCVLNDARETKKALEDVGFTVTSKIDCTQQQMRDAIDKFGRDLANYKVGLFYYSGHGTQAKRVSYLVPIDAQVRTEDDVETKCVSANRLLERMRDARAQVNIMILDACRSPTKDPTAIIGPGGRGLARMDAPAGSIIAYATAPGKVAMGGSPKELSVYTAALVRYIKTPGIPIEDMFRRVRVSVLKDTKGRQLPWESTCLTKPFFFRKK